MEMLSTYRLQFHKGFTFAEAAAIVPYLHDLGITHVYASPYLKAVAGSTHGYDVIDHSQLNPEVGSDENYRHFVKVLADHGMSHILDTVPNHMGVDTNDNRWWNDVLLHGRGSQFGEYFDIDWDQYPPRPQLVNKVLLPVLGEPLGQVLKNNQLEIKQEDHGTFVYYYDRKFPIEGGSTFDGELSALLDRQHYRLAFWRVSPDEINYRRFFDVTSLAGLQMQRQDVFNAAHDFTFSLIADGSVDGLRVDHPDGLRNPKQYFARLQEKFKSACPIQAASGKPLYVSVEKILNGDERLRDDWSVSGTSGYDFLCAVNDLSVDTASEAQMTAIYSSFVNDHTKFADLVYQKKCMILDTSLNSELTALTSRLDALAQLDLSTRDFTGRQLREALRAVIACFAVYRSYVSDEGVHGLDESVVHQAVDEAHIREPAIAEDALSFVRDAVLLRLASPSLQFAQRFQQLTSPVNAKGIEDTAFYIYNRLVSLNEVGGDPARFGRSAEALHDYFQDRSAKWPLALSSLSTHDTKRSEDVRTRISALSEIPQEWKTRLARWSTLNAELTTSVHPNDQYLLYQTLIGAWPFSPMDEAGRTSLVTRVRAYMQKAMREAKLRTAWTAVNEEYEAAVSKLISDLVDPQISLEFVDDFVKFQNKISRIGLMNSLSQTVLRLTAPGIPDTYQGTELWDFSLVDPDNRRPVDFNLRRKMLNEVKQANLQELIAHLDDGRLKLWITWKLLHLRQQYPELFLGGEYHPIAASGERAKNVFAFVQSAPDQSVIVVVSRLTTQLGDSAWQGASLQLPASINSASLTNAFTGKHIAVGSDRRMELSQILSELSVAVLLTN